MPDYWNVNLPRALAMQKSKKIVLLGHFGVGKTSLIRRFVENSFSEDYKVTIGVHITKKIISLSAREHMSLIIWDLEGTDRLADLRTSYLLGSHGIIYVFDITRPSTFQNLKDDLETVRSLVKDTPVKVVGNKLDLVDREHTKQLMSDMGINPDFLTSAKTGETVEDLFHQLAMQLLHA